MIHLQAYQNTNLKFLHIKKEMLCNVALCKLGKREMNHEPQNFGRDPFNQNFQKFRSKTQWIGSVQPEKFQKNGSTF